MNFERYRAQLLCESIYGCRTPEQWHQADFKNLQLNRSQAANLSLELREDAKDFYFKGLLSLFEAVKSINENLFSWATVKFYYSAYYFLRSTMAASDTALIRKKSLFYLRAIEGEKPLSKSHKRYNTDHSGTINFFIDFFGSDKLLSQNIDGTNVYDWMMSKREQVNYKERYFNEPNCPIFWSSIAEQLRKGNLELILNKYIEDRFILCFQEEHAILAIPLKRAMLTKQILDAENIDINLSKEQSEMLLSLLPIKIEELTLLTKTQIET